MAHRTFRDHAGHLWEVWAAFPDPGSPGVKPTPPDGTDAHTTNVPITVPQHLTGGWLVFVCLDHDERKRYAPVPEGWDLASRESLRTYLDAASLVTRF